MKLYKGDKVMMSVGKDQVEICLEAGWSRTKPEPEPEVVKEATETDVDETDEKEDKKTPSRKRPVISRTAKRK